MFGNVLASVVETSILGQRIGFAYGSSLATVQLVTSLKLFGSFVKSYALGSTVDGAKPGDAELLAGLHHRISPSAILLEKLLPALEHLLAHHLSLRIKHQISFDKPALGVLAAPVPHLSVRSGLHLLRHSLRLSHRCASNGLLCFGCSGFRCFHGFRCFGFASNSLGLPGGFTGGTSGDALFG